MDKLPTSLKWSADGLLPVVIVDARTNEPLTLAYADRDALARTIETRQTHLYSRSRRSLWRKGETSGDTQHVESIASDCDGDALLYRVVPSGPACHTGQRTCFHNEIMPPAAVRRTRGGNRSFLQAIEHLERVLEQRKSASPDSSYVAKLYAGGVDAIGKKIGEEATEVVIAAKNESREELIWEASDLIFHLLVMLKERGIALDEIGDHLRSRAK